MKILPPRRPPHARLLRAPLLHTIVLLAVATASMAAPPPPLPALNIAIEDTSVSGISSGAFMSVQMQVAHSAIIRGAGIVAGGPYYCAQDSVMKATTECSCTGEPTLSCKVGDASTAVPELVAATRAFHSEGRIDDPAQIARQRVVTVVGGKDALVPAPITRQLHGYYDAFGVPATALRSVTLDAAGHTMPTTAYGGACSVTDEPYIGKCDFEAAHAILDWIYGPDVAPPRTTPKPAGRFIEFDQRSYIPETSFFSYLWGTGLDKTGWLYVPPACEAGERCRLHVVFHGCKQGQSFLPLRRAPDGGLYNGTTFVRNTGYDRWADTNRLVVLFPQAVSIPWKNPNGCWDWWGFTDDDYATRDGIQIRSVRAMIDHLASGRRD